jgi:alkylation response protein AidB-like acyl-CoA dehydrogenase
MDESDRQFDFLREWQRKVFDAGYLGLDWPSEYGGGGDVLKRQRIVSQEISRARAPFFVNTIGLQWAGPTILSYGTEAQKQRYLKPILSAEEIWCQGFSEPGAGSDLAGVQTRAERSGDGWRVTGHKVWTTIAHKSKWMILLARTDPSVGKYAGLSYFLFPMEAPGVSVQPLIKMTGEGGFNQVIIDDAPMPREALLGEEGQGWQVAMTTLTFERGAAEGSGGGNATASAGSVARVAALARRTRRGGDVAALDPVLRDRLARLHGAAHAGSGPRLRAPHGPASHEQARLLGVQPGSLRARLRDPRPRRPAVAGRPRGGRPRRVAAGVHELLRDDDRRRNERDPAQHPRRARARPAQEQMSRK